MTTPAALSAAVSLLRGAGYAVVPPEAAQPPEIAVGQVWASQIPGVRPRTITRWSGGEYDGVYYTSPGRKLGGVRFPSSFLLWARQNSARPVTP